MVGIIDCGIGNILSVKNAFEAIGADTKICIHPEQLKDYERIVLPGVGAFGDCMAKLQSRGFLAALNNEVVGNTKPILGICLGMQVMAKHGFEGGEKFNGLGWFDADVVRLNPSDKSLRIPHVGWNNINIKQENPLFNRLPQAADFYFVHSYYMVCRDNGDIAAEFEYGGNFTAAVQKRNIFATQFHPEKSQDFGLMILKNFIQWKP